MKNEKQFAEWFKKNYKKLGFSKIIREDIGVCPDFIMLRNGEEIKVELETVASNFIHHKHSLDDVDEIICIVKNIELGKPTIKVKELEYKSDRTKVTLSLDEDIYKEFQDFCEENDIMLSKRIERLIKEHISENKKRDNGK